jgi:CRP-like cAMP-binding protein
MDFEHSKRVSIPDMPHKAGNLTKKAIAGTLGYRNKKTRWFKLEAGELRYYNSAECRPSELKNVIKLVGCSVSPDPNVREAFSLILPDQKTLDVRVAASAPRDAVAHAGVGLSCSMLVVQLQAATAQDARDWIEILKEAINVVDRLAQRERTRTRRQNIAVENDDRPLAPLPVVQKSPETMQLLNEALHNHFMLANLKDKTPIIDAMQLLEFEPGDVVIWEGDVGDLFYVLEKGKTEVLKEGQSGSLGSMQAGKAFGELALVHNTPRAVTIRCLSPVVAWAVDRATFRRVVNSQESKDRDERMRFLRRVPLFNPLNDGTMAKICDALQLQSFSANQVIFRQGDTGDCFYIVKTGQVNITQQTVSAAPSSMRVEQPVRLTNN